MIPNLYAVYMNPVAKIILAFGFGLTMCALL